MSVILGIDFGAESIEICQKGKGIILREPCIAAVDATGNVMAVGTEALLLSSRAPGTMTLRCPFENGLISDFNLTAEVLDRFLEAAAPKTKKHIVAAVKYSMNEPSRQILKRALADCRTGKVTLVDTITAAFMGLNLSPSEDPFGGAVLCDMGAEAVEAAYIRNGEVLRQISSNVGGIAQKHALMAHVKNKYGITLSSQSVQELELRVSLKGDSTQHSVVSGIDTATGMPRKITVTDKELKKLYTFLLEPVSKLLLHMLRNLPTHGENESHADNIILIGGGAAIPGIDEYLTAQIGKCVTVTDSPVDAVVRGLEIMCKNSCNLQSSIWCL